jgi:hypothetical protein
LLQGFVDLDDIDVPRRRRTEVHVFELFHGAGRRRASALLAQTHLRVIDEDAPHLSRCHVEKVDAVLPRDVHLHELDKSFMDDSRRLERVSRAFLSHVLASPVAQLLVNERSELLERPRISRFPGG